MSIALKASDILARLPHRHPPMVLLDRVEDLNYGKSATGIKNITISDPVFQGHFPPNNPPCTLASTLLKPRHSCAGSCWAPPLQVKTAPPSLGTWRQYANSSSSPVYPGDVLSIQARAGVSHANLADFSVDIKVSGKIVASGSLALARIDPDPST